QPYKSELKRLKLELSPLFDEIYYVSADRLGPQKFYDNYNPQDFIHTGKKGEYTAQVIATHKNVQINDVRSNNEAETQNLIDQASFWLSEILDTPNLQIKIDDANPYINILTFVINGKEFRPHNVGFGFSYTLPIIISGLIAEKRSILIIENPEAHLHPKAQTELIKFLTLVAEAGVQVFIESHSDHILNGLRVAIKQELIKPKNVSVLYFYGKNNIEIANPKIDKDGRIDQWPDGFFDEWDNNLMLLM
ncbi:MAG: DUF3696 domain-containing protein, partial [Thermonemataceae bacterium]|nr:DUF3696 domain-containing protein [Thermonemataceae bacterium]